MVYHFLTYKKHFVRMPGGLSDDHPVISGVPQGTVLGPLLFIIIIADINRDVDSSKLISFADDTRVYSRIADIEDCDSLLWDLNSVYKWASNDMFFNAKKIHYLPLSSSQVSNKSNIYINPSMDIIPQSTDVPDLGIIMSKYCSFDYHISSLSRKCNNLAGWILKSFVSSDKLTMLTLFKTLVISRLDYASLLWSPHKISQITQIEKVQRSFTVHIAGLRDLSYHEKLQTLKPYSLQRRRERYCIILIWKIIENKSQNFSDPILCNFSDRRGRSCVISHVNTGRHGTLAYNSFRWRAI